jgi:HD-GYP domain-containing protein (c-di-GMP phosphodiesterase class II)
VCDAYDAMTAPRSYREAMGMDDALAELRRCAGSQFDPAIVEAFCAVTEALRTALTGAAEETDVVDGPAVLDAA